MIIDKVTPFYTAEDQEQLAEHEKAADSFLEDVRALSRESAAAAKKGERLEDWQARFTALWYTYKDIQDTRDKILLSIEQRYIDSFKGDTSAIMEDVREIVGAIEKADYITWQKRATETYKTLTEKKPGKDASSETKRLYRIAKEASVQGFTNCRLFILELLRVQLNALDFYGTDAAEVLAIVEEKTATFYKKPKGAAPVKPRQDKRLYPTDLPAASVHGAFITKPTSPALNLLEELLTGGSLEDLEDRKRHFNRNAKVEVMEAGDKRQISYTNKNQKITVEIDDFKKLANKNPQTKKLFVRILVHANAQSLDNANLYKPAVSFPLRELLGPEQYSNLDSARKGFWNSMGTLTGFKVKGETFTGNRKLQSGSMAVLFTGADVDNANCTVWLNERINWKYLFQYYTGLPDYYFELPNRAAELLLYIFYRARQSTQQIQEHGYFTISFRSIQSRLNLPDETATKNPKRDIKDAIEDSIEDIEEKYRQFAPKIPRSARGAAAIPDFTLLPEVDSTAPIKKYLDEGRLKVSLKGEYAARFIEVSERTAKRIKAAEKRRERALENAAALKPAEEN